MQNQTGNYMALSDHFRAISDLYAKLAEAEGAQDQAEPQPEAPEPPPKKKSTKKAAPAPQPSRDALVELLNLKAQEGKRKGIMAILDGTKVADLTDAQVKDVYEKVEAL